MWYTGAVHIAMHHNHAFHMILFSGAYYDLRLLQTAIGVGIHTIHTYNNSGLHICYRGLRRKQRQWRRPRWRRTCRHPTKHRKHSGNAIRSPTWWTNSWMTYTEWARAAWRPSRRRTRRTGATVAETRPRPAARDGPTGWREKVNTIGYRWPDGGVL